MPGSPSRTRPVSRNQGSWLGGAAQTKIKGGKPGEGSGIYEKWAKSQRRRIPKTGAAEARGGFDAKLSDRSATLACRSARIHSPTPGSLCAAEKRLRDLSRSSLQGIEPMQFLHKFCLHNARILSAA